MLFIVAFQVPGELEAHRRFAGAFFAEDDRRGRLGGVAIDLVPGGVKGAFDTEFFEDWIGLRIFLGKRISGNAVVLEELLDLHATRWLKVRNAKKTTLRKLIARSFTWLAGLRSFY